ncbi:MAG: hypothetical protein KIT76_00250 [Pseudolabrys sp.]|nr:hypothetical protein [Pseudolabrys sp.]
MIVVLVVAGLAVLGGALLLASWGDKPAGPPSVTAETSPPAAGVPPRNVGFITAKRWERYINTRYGVVIDYPADLFAIQPPPPDNAGRSFVAEAAGARFSIYSHANAMDFSVEELQAEDVLDIGDEAAVKQSGRNWYQVVAGKNGDVILRRVLLSEEGTFVHRLEIAYPKAAAAAFEPIAARMAKSFSVDPSIPEKAATDAERRAPQPPATPATPATPAPPSAAGATAPQSPPAQAGGFTYRRVDSIGLGLRLDGAKSKVGFSVEVPADWRLVQGRDGDSLFFATTDPSYGGEIVLAFVVERRGAGETLASKVEDFKAQSDAASRKNIYQGAARIGLLPAIMVVFPMGEFRKTVAYVEKDDHFYYMQLHAPTRLYEKYGPVLERAISSIAFAQ